MGIELDEYIDEVDEVMDIDMLTNDEVNRLVLSVMVVGIGMHWGIEAIVMDTDE